ncbi:MAG: adenosylcobinamide-phosphate synthase CbiB [Paracoccaceae bacterium]
MSFAVMMVMALALDVALGWPDGVYRRVRHPVVWIGALIGWLDRRLNHPDLGAWRHTRRAKGVLCVVLTVGAAVVPAIWVQMHLTGWWGLLLGAVLAWPLIAARSMYDHVAAVARPLEQGDIASARKAVAMIVGRDPQQLGPEGVARAGIESLAENTSDGIVAPLFWGAVLGLPGLVAYKAINTLDSMIGYRNDRYRDFGWAAARLDDGVNLIPARVTGGLFALVSRWPLRALRGMMRDAGKHRSPNAGWPEAAMAVALEVRLSGPRVYGTQITDEPWVNGSAPDPVPTDLRKGLRIYVRALTVLALIVLMLGLIGPAWGFGGSTG